MSTAVLGAGPEALRLHQILTRVTSQGCLPFGVRVVHTVGVLATSRKGAVSASTLELSKSSRFVYLSVQTAQ